MSPPASEAAYMSACTSAATASPLSERDCNGGANLPCCQLACKPPLAVRCGTSFLDAEDACLELPDKACFLIPEDSYLPGQENCSLRGAPAAVASCPPAPPCPTPRPAPSTGALPFRPQPPSVAAGARPPLRSAFQLTDASLFAGDEEFVAASVCFEKAEQELEMVERPNNAPPLKPRRCQLSPRGCTNLLRRDFGTCAVPHPRHASSLVPSPTSSSGQQPQGSDGVLPAQPQHQSAGGSSAESFEDDTVTSTCAELQAAVAAVVVEDAVSAVDNIQVPADWLRPQQQPGGPGYEGAAGAADCYEWGPESVPVSPAAPAGAALLAAAAPRAFHHKTGGPCDHCGATESPQWRRGPAAKPMLCNACGTRFRRTNQLNPASANSAAARAASAAAAATLAMLPYTKGRGTKRHFPAACQSAAAKRGRAGHY